MPKRYAYVVTCIKETPMKWGIALESLGEAVPPKIVRFPHLMQSLTRSPYFQSEADPMAYFRQLVKGVPEMLRGYNKRILNQIQRRMNQLPVGGCCHIKISYIDNGEGISPYNYNLQPIEDPPIESRDILLQMANRAASDQPFITQNGDTLSASLEEDSGLQRLNTSNDNEPVEQLIYSEVDRIQLIAQLNGKIGKLQADLERLRSWLVETLPPSQEIQGMKATEIEVITAQETSATI